MRDLILNYHLVTGDAIMSFGQATRPYQPKEADKTMRVYNLLSV